MNHAQCDQHFDFSNLSQFMQTTFKLKFAILSFEIKRAWSPIQKQHNKLFDYPKTALFCANTVCKFIAFK